MSKKDEKQLEKEQLIREEKEFYVLLWAGSSLTGLCARPEHRTDEELTTRAWEIAETMYKEGVKRGWIDIFE